MTTIVRLFKRWQVRCLAQPFAIVAAFVPISVHAAQVSAPLPDGYQASGQNSIPGIYAEVNGLTSVYDDQQIEEFEDACKADGKIVVWQDRDKASKGAVRIYRTSAAVAVIRDSARLSTDQKTCVARYVIEHEATVKVGSWDYKEIAYFENPDLKCGNSKIVRRCHESIVAGVKVTCLNRGDGLNGDVICVSLNNDLTRGLLVGYSSYVDDGSMPTGGWQLSRIEQNALIDPVIFRADPKN
jgi:hypothetical protein